MSTYNEMKKKAESDQNRIELRSEKVRNMIGEMPSFLVRCGKDLQSVCGYNYPEVPKPRDLQCPL